MPATVEIVCFPFLFSPHGMLCSLTSSNGASSQEDQGVTEGTMAGMTMNDDGMFGAKPTQAMSAADTGGGDAASVTGTHVTGGGATADAGSSLEGAEGVGGMTAAMAAAAGGMAEVPAGGEGLAQAVEVYDWDRSDWKVCAPFFPLPCDPLCLLPSPRSFLLFFSCESYAGARIRSLKEFPCLSFCWKRDEK
jgi:hypothetical protein